MKKKFCVTLLSLSIIGGGFIASAGSHKTSTLGGTFCYGNNPSQTYSQFYHSSYTHGSDVSVSDIGWYDSDFNQRAGLWSDASVSKCVTGEMNIAGCVKGSGSYTNDQYCFYN